MDQTKKQTSQKTLSFNRNSLFCICGCIAAFALLLYFFLKLHPIMLFDSDDWYYLGVYRRPIPIWGAQNPIKAFPEYFLPLSNYIASKLIYPFTGNIFTAISIKDAILLALAITVYVYMFMRLVYKHAKSILNTAVLSVLFLLLHFVIFRSAEVNNRYLFYSLDQTTVYHYLIPAVINATIALYLMRDDLLTDFFSKGKPVQKILFPVAAYFAIFSNITACIISAVFVGCSLLSDLINIGQDSFLTFLKRRCMKIVYLLAWGVAQVFEVNGNRAFQLSTQNDFLTEFSAGSRSFLSLISTMNRVVIAIFAAIFLCFMILLILSLRCKTVFSLFSKKEGFLLGSILLSSVLTYIYLLLVASKAGAYYVSRSDVTFGFFSFLLIFLMMLLLIIVRKIPKAAWGAAVITVLLAFQTNTPGKTFLESNMLNADASLLLEINNDSFDQIMAAYNAGETAMNLLVPKFDSEDNWPLANYGGSFYYYGLHNTGFLNHGAILIIVTPTEEKNAQFGL